jgi:hypothetical protein
MFSRSLYEFLAPIDRAKSLPVPNGSIPMTTSFPSTPLMISLTVPSPPTAITRSKWDRIACKETVSASLEWVVKCTSKGKLARFWSSRSKLSHLDLVFPLPALGLTTNKVFTTNALCNKDVRLRNPVFNGGGLNCSIHGKQAVIVM